MFDHQCYTKASAVRGSVVRGLSLLSTNYLIYRFVKNQFKDGQVKSLVLFLIQPLIIIIIMYYYYYTQHCMCAIDNYLVLKSRNNRCKIFEILLTCGNLTFDVDILLPLVVFERHGLFFCHQSSFLKSIALIYWRQIYGKNV